MIPLMRKVKEYLKIWFFNHPSICQYLHGDNRDYGRSSANIRIIPLGRLVGDGFPSLVDILELAG